MSLKRKRATVGGRLRCFRAVRSDRRKKSGVVVADLALVTATSRVTGFKGECVKQSDPETEIGRPINPRAMADLQPDVRLSGCGNR